jgi:hypothetical protein
MPAARRCRATSDSRGADAAVVRPGALPGRSWGAGHLRAPVGRTIAAALVAELTALGAAAVLSQRHGPSRGRSRRPPPHPGLAPRSSKSRRQPRQAWFHRAHRCMKVAAERAQEQQQLLAEWRPLHDERVQPCELRRARNAARCGAETRTGAPCKRRPEPGNARCRNRGGASTGPRTPEGRERALAARECRRETQRLRAARRPES